MTEDVQPISRGAIQTPRFIIARVCLGAPQSLPERDDFVKYEYDSSVGAQIAKHLKKTRLWRYYPTGPDDRFTASTMGG
jgi:hypothetical protein